MQTYDSGTAPLYCGVYQARRVKERIRVRVRVMVQSFVVSPCCSLTHSTDLINVITLQQS